MARFVASQVCAAEADVERQTQEDGNQSHPHAVRGTRLACLSRDVFGRIDHVRLSVSHGTLRYSDGPDAEGFAAHAA